jgi:hypothetical protein
VESCKLRYFNSFEFFDHGGLPNISRLSVWTYFFLAAASHGLLDAMTDGGLGVAFFAPFDEQPLLCSMDSYSSLPHWYRAIFYESRVCGHPK